MTKSYNKLTQDDITEINETYHDDFYSNGDIIKVIESNPDILHDARKWGWNDTEVRDEISLTCKKLNIDFNKYL